jgi:HTH-type transcriptional regulator/antitoxin HipB
MKLTTHSQLHDEWMKNPEYRSAYEEDNLNEQLADTLTKWRDSQNLSRTDVAIRMGISLDSLSSVEDNFSQASLLWFYSYAKACNVVNPIIRFNTELD